MNRLSISVFALSITILLFTVAQIAIAQSKEDWRKASSNQSPSLTLQQNYHGTTPGSGNTLPKVEEIRTKEGSWITWPGFFIREDGGSRLFIQTTQPLKYQQKKKKKKIVLSFKKTKIYLSNNQNPLVTLHFNTPIKKANLRKTKKKVDLIIDLKLESEAIISQESIGDGYHYLYVDFPPGQYPMGGEWGDRPSYRGVGDPASSQVPDEEIPAEKP